MGALIPAVVNPLRGREEKVSDTGFRIRGTEHDRIEPGMHHGAGAHHARFQRDVERAPGQAVVAHGPPRCAQGHDLGMRGRVVVENGAVVTLTDDDATADHDGTDRHFTGGLGLLGEGDGRLHPALIGLRAHSHSMVAGGFPEMS